MTSDVNGGLAGAQNRAVEVRVLGFQNEGFLMIMMTMSVVIVMTMVVYVSVSGVVGLSSATGRPRSVVTALGSSPVVHITTSIVSVVTVISASIMVPPPESVGSFGIVIGIGVTIGGRRVSFIISRAGFGAF